MAPTQRWTGLTLLLLVGLLHALLLAWLAFRVAEPWVPWLSCAADVALTSAALLFVLRHGGAAVPARSLFQLYFLVILSAGPRFRWAARLRTAGMVVRPPRAAAVGCGGARGRDRRRRRGTCDPGGALRDARAWRHHHGRGGPEGEAAPADGRGGPPHRSVAAGAVRRAHRRGAGPGSAPGRTAQRGHPGPGRMQGVQRHLRAPGGRSRAAGRRAPPALRGAKERPGRALRGRGVRRRLPGDRGGAGATAGGAHPGAARASQHPGGPWRAAPGHGQRRPQQLARGRRDLRRGTDLRGRTPL